MHYVICSDQATQLGCLNITDVSDCSNCTKTFNSSDRFAAGSKVVMFAVNGAGNGNEATFQITADGALYMYTLLPNMQVIDHHSYDLHTQLHGGQHVIDGYIRGN